jgi:glucose/arabinose dehydrogenase
MPEEYRVGMLKTPSRILIFFTLSAAVIVAQSPRQLPPPFATPSADNRSQVVPKPDNARVSVPNGFTAEVVADGFDTPRFMLPTAGGEVLLSDSARATPGKGSVYVIADKDKNGSFESKTRILDNLDRPFGIALWKDYIYVAETTSLKRYKFDAATLKATTPGSEVVSLKDFGSGHWTRMVVFDSKAEKMFLTVGSGSNVDAGENPMRAAVHRYNPDGTGHEIFASGTRNPVSLKFYPGTDTLFATVQERDALGDDLVPDYLTSLKQGGFYGWPYAYIGPNEDPRRKGEKPDLVKKAIVPDVLMGAHTAVLDFIFYNGKMFPASYQGGAFVARHGSWNRSKRVAYDLAFVPFKDGKPTGEPRPFLTGFMLSPDSKDVWGRPVGVAQLADGSLLMSDDGGKKLWRISYKGGQTTAGR